MDYLSCYENRRVFNGTLGTWKIASVGFESRETVNQICSRP